MNDHDAAAPGKRRDGRIFGLGRKLGSSGLQLLILKLLAEKPRHGYDVIATLENLTNGYYAPSAGMVYPALTALEQCGRAASRPAGTRKTYLISDAGRAYLQEHRAAADDMLAHFVRIGEWIGRAQRALGRDDADDTRAGADLRGGSELMRAKRQLRLALGDRSGSSVDEQQRIAAVLNRATAEILAKGRVR